MATAASMHRFPLGFALTLLLAAVQTGWDLWFFAVSSYDVAPVWAWLQVPVVAGAWGAAVAWRARRWLLAGCGLLLSLGGVWGYFYIPPLVALVLALVAFSRAFRRASR